MSGLGFVRLPKESLKVLRAFLDGFYRERSLNLFNHPHVIDACRGRKLSKETQLFNELVLWLRYYEALVARRPTHLDLMERIRSEYDKLFTFVRADGELSPYFGLSDVDIVGGMIYTDDYIPRVDVFISGLYDLSAYLSAKDGRKVVDKFGFINLRSDETQRLVANARAAAENLHAYRILDVRDFENHDPLVVALNRLMYLCRVAYAMSKGWKEIREGAIDRANLLRRRLILSMHENPAFARIYVRNALEPTVEHSNVYGVLRRLEEDRVLFKNALQWGDPDWGLDSTTEDDEGEDDEGDDDEGEGSFPSYVDRGASLVRDRLLSDSDTKRSGLASLHREQSRRDSLSSWRSVTEGDLTDEGDAFPSVLDAPKPLIADPAAVTKKSDVKRPPTPRPKTPKRRPSIGSSSVMSKGETLIDERAQPSKAYWLEDGKSLKDTKIQDRGFVSNGKMVSLPTPSDIGAAAVPLPPSLSSFAPSVPLPAATRMSLSKDNPFGSGIRPDGAVIPPLSYVDEKYFRPAESHNADGTGEILQKSVASAGMRSRGVGGKGARSRRKSAVDSRSSGAAYRKPRAARSEDEDGYYWDDLEALEDTASAALRNEEVFAPDEEFERIQQRLQGLNINSPTAATGPPQFISPAIPKEPLKARNSLFVSAEEEEERRRNAGGSDSSGVTVLSSDTNNDQKAKSK